MPTVKYLLIGGGLASAEAAKQIRRVDAEGSIALVSDEALLPYNRPPLSKEYLRGEATEPLEFASAADYEELRVTTVLGSAVTSLDASASTATLDNGEVYSFEQALLATGGSPVRLPVPGADLAGVYYLRDAGDADAIGAAAKEAKRAVVVGAGFIGLETAASLRQMGLDVTVVEMADAIWPRFADRNLAAHVQKLSEARGVEFLMGSPVEGFEGDGGRVSAVLTGERSVACDLAVVGVGIRPNTGLAEQRRPGGRQRHRGRRADAFVGRRTCSPPATWRTTPTPSLRSAGGWSTGATPSTRGRSPVRTWPARRCATTS